MHSMKSITKEIIFWAITVLISAVAFIPYIPIGVMGFSADDVLFLTVLFIGIFFLFFNWGKCKKLPENFTWSFLFLAGVGFFSALYNAKNVKDFSMMIDRGPVRFLLTLFFLIIIYNLLDSKEKIKKMLIALVGFSAVESIFGFFSYIFSWQGPFNIGIATQRDYSVLSILTNVHGRINGTFGSVIENFIGSNLLGAYLIMLIPIAVVFIIISKKFWQKAIFSLILLSQLICLSLTYTRTSIVYAVIILLLFARMIEKKKIFLVIIMGAILFSVFTPGLKERFLIDSTDRVAIWKSAVLVAKEHPFWGVGPGRYLEELSADMIDYDVFAFEIENITPHNFFLWIWAVLGFFGVMAVLWIIWEIVKSFWNAFHGINDYDSKVLISGVIASSIGFFLQNLTNNFLFVPVVAIYFWTLMVCGLKLWS